MKSQRSPRKANGYVDRRNNDEDTVDDSNYEGTVGDGDLSMIQSVRQGERGQTSSPPRHSRPSSAMSANTSKASNYSNIQGKRGHTSSPPRQSRPMSAMSANTANTSKATNSSNIQSQYDDTADLSRSRPQSTESGFSGILSKGASRASEFSGIQSQYDAMIRDVAMSVNTSKASNYSNIQSRYDGTADLSRSRPQSTESGFSGIQSNGASRASEFSGIQSQYDAMIRDVSNSNSRGSAAISKIQSMASDFSNVLSEYDDINASRSRGGGSEYSGIQSNGASRASEFSDIESTDGNRSKGDRSRGGGSEYSGIQSTHDDTSNVSDEMDAASTAANIGPRDSFSRAGRTKR